MELNPDLVDAYTDIHNAISVGITGKHNIFKLAPGLCHAQDITVRVDGTKLEESQYVALLPSSEFRIRYMLDSVSAIMIVDNALVGTVEIGVKPIGGIFQNVELPEVPTLGYLADYVGHYLEEVGSITGLENFYRAFDDIPSRATDIDGILYGRASYPGAANSSITNAALDRILALEQKAFHSDVSIPSINVTNDAYIVLDRAAPRIQLTSDAPEVTWHVLPELSDIYMQLNAMSGEIEWVDGIADAGVYAVTIYIMSNGIKSENTIIYLNVT